MIRKVNMMYEACMWIFHFNRPTVAPSTGHDSDENGPIVLMTTGPIKLN